MAINRDQKIIITSADGTQRRRLPKSQILDASARIERYGGYGQFTVNTSLPVLSALSTIIKGDRVEMYYLGVLRYRGYVEELSPSAEEPDKLTIKGYGQGFLVGQQLCYGRYAWPGVGVDISAAAAEIVRDFTVSHNQTVPSAMGRAGLPLYGSTDFQTVGTTTTGIDAYQKLSKDVFSDLVETQAGNLSVWGCDVDDFGRDRLYIRPIAARTFPPRHMIRVPSINTESAAGEDQAGDIKNRILVTGGNPKFPQLLHNGGFDLPTVFQDGDSGIIADGDFESQTWTLSGGASYKDGGNEEGQPFSGKYMVELDHVGEAIDKSGTWAFTNGHNHTFSCRSRKELGLQTATGSGYLHILNVSNTLLLSVPLSLTPDGDAWDYFSATFIMPAAAAKWAVHFQCDTIAAYLGDQGGLLIDAVALYDAEVVYQDGWQATIQGSPAAFNAINWVYKDVSYSGIYSVLINVSANDADGQDAHLEPLGQATFQVLKKQTLRYEARYRSPVVRASGLDLPKFFLDIEWRKK